MFDFSLKQNHKIKATQIDTLCNELTARLDKLGSVLKTQLQVRSTNYRIVFDSLQPYFICFCID